MASTTVAGTVIRITAPRRKNWCEKAHFFTLLHTFFERFTSFFEYFRTFSNIFKRFRTFLSTFFLPILPKPYNLTNQPPFLHEKPTLPAQKKTKNPFFSLNYDNFSPLSLIPKIIPAGTWCQRPQQSDYGGS